jgi:hypothetical protein
MSWRRAGKAFLMWAAGITVLVVLAVVGNVWTPTHSTPPLPPNVTPGPPRP